MTTAQYKRKLAAKASARQARLKLFALPLHVKRNREAYLLLRYYRQLMQWHRLDVAH